MRFLLVDAIVDLEPGIRAIGIKNVTMSEDFLTDHFPGRPIMPGMLIVESMVQLADWVIREASDFTTLGIASGFENIKFRRIVRPSDQLRLEVRRLSGTDGTATFGGKAYREGDLVASAQLTLALHPIEAYLDPQEARREFRILQLPVTEEETP